jgi:hypothetical protein
VSEAEGELMALVPARVAFPPARAAACACGLLELLMRLARLMRAALTMRWSWRQ